MVYPQLFMHMDVSNSEDLFACGRLFRSGVQKAGSPNK